MHMHMQIGMDGWVGKVGKVARKWGKEGGRIKKCVCRKLCQAYA